MFGAGGRELRRVSSSPRAPPRLQLLSKS
uniref:Uncharacterized protein n=1 Tax=Arundo donax TaxID=35708 RepID=A0A0A9A2C7_ARUDO